jgi:hypothetical protein
MTYAARFFSMLIVNCNPDMLILEDEWNDAVQRAL